MPPGELWASQFVAENRDMTAVGGRRLGLGRTLAVGFIDVVAAILIAMLVFRLFGASSGVDPNPPVCYNAAGGVVSCDLTQAVLMLPTFGIVLFVLVVWQVFRWRRRRP